MQRLEVSGVVRLIYRSLSVKRLMGTALLTQLIAQRVVANFSHLTEPKILLTFTKDLATYLYSELEQSTLHLLILFLKTHFNIIHSSSLVLPSYYFLSCIASKTLYALIFF